MLIKKVTPLPLWQEVGTVIISQTVNRVLAGRGFFEEPQLTHVFNYESLTVDELALMSTSQMVSLPGLPHEKPSHQYGIPWCHMGRWGGWRRYVVLQPREEYIKWYVGWVVGGKASVSRIQLRGPVRLLHGDRPVRWFGLSVLGVQRKIDHIGHGEIGLGGPYAKLPLL